MRPALRVGRWLLRRSRDEQHQHWRTVKLEDFALTLGKLEGVDYVPPLGGSGGGMPIEAVAEAAHAVRITLANGQVFELSESER
jgi:hypothetical protein